MQYSLERPVKKDKEAISKARCELLTVGKLDTL